MTLESMGNSLDTAGLWVKALASRPEIPFAKLLDQHFAAAKVTRLCDCGCNSFDCELPAGARLQPLVKGAKGGAFFEIAFESKTAEPIDIIFFCDARGYLSGIDINHGLSNSQAMPGPVPLGRMLYTIPAAYAL